MGLYIKTWCDNNGKLVYYTDAEIQSSNIQDDSLCGNAKTSDVQLPKKIATAGARPGTAAVPVHVATNTYSDLTEKSRGSKAISKRSVPLSNDGAEYMREKAAKKDMNICATASRAQMNTSNHTITESEDTANARSGPDHPVDGDHVNTAPSHVPGDIRNERLMPVPPPVMSTSTDIAARKTAPLAGSSLANCDTLNHLSVDFFLNRIARLENDISNLQTGPLGNPAQADKSGNPIDSCPAVAPDDLASLPAGIENESRNGPEPAIVVHARTTHVMPCENSKGADGQGNSNSNRNRPATVLCGVPHVPMLPPRSKPPLHGILRPAGAIVLQMPVVPLQPAPQQLAAPGVGIARWHTLTGALHDQKARDKEKRDCDGSIRRRLDGEFCSMIADTPAMDNVQVPTLGPHELTNFAGHIDVHGSTPNPEFLPHSSAISRNSTIVTNRGGRYDGVVTPAGSEANGKFHLEGLYRMKRGRVEFKKTSSTFHLVMPEDVQVVPTALLGYELAVAQYAFLAKIWSFLAARPGITYTGKTAPGATEAPLQSLPQIFDACEVVRYFGRVEGMTRERVDVVWTAVQREMQELGPSHFLSFANLPSQAKRTLNRSFYHLESVEGMLSSIIQREFYRLGVRGELSRFAPKMRNSHKMAVLDDQLYAEFGV